MLRIALPLGGTDCGQSGIGVYLRAIVPRLCRALSASGGELTVFGTPIDVDAYDDVLGDARRVVLPSLLTSPGINALFHFLGAGVLSAHAKASVLFLPAASRRIVARSPIPTVAVVHDIAPLYVPGKYDALRTFYLKHSVMPALRHASHIVAVSHFTQNDIARSLECPLSRIDVVPNGVDVQRFTPPVFGDERVQAARIHLNMDGPYILYLGRLEHPGKNHLRLIEAFAASTLAANHTLVLAGQDWGALPLIRDAASRLQIAHRMHITGFLPDEIIPGLVAGADSVAMVGLYEGFGLPALEALAAGRPVFVANTGALTEVTGDLAASCDPLDCNSIQRALETTITDSKFRTRALAEGPTHALQYGWDSAADELLSICRRAAAASAN